MNNFTDKLVNGILSFFMTIILIVSLIVATLSTSLLNQNYISERFTGVTYCQGVLESVTDEILALGIPSQVTNDEIKDVFTFKQVQNDCVIFISRSFEQAEFQLDTTEMKTKLVSNILSSYSENNVEITDEITKNANSFAQQAIEIYENTINFSYITFITRAVIMFNRYVFPICSVLVVLGVIVISMIFAFNKYRHRSLRQLSYSISATSLFAIIVSISLLTFGFYKNVQLSPSYFLNIFTRYISNGLIMMFVFGFVLIIVNLINYVIIWKLRRGSISKK